MYMKDKEKINAVAEAVAKILEAEMKVPYGEGDKEVKDGPAIRSHKAKPVDPKEYTDKLDKKYAKPSPFAGGVKEATEDLEEGSGPKEKQKTPYRNINSPEYRAAAAKQKEKMEKDDAATPGKKLLNRLKGKQYKLDKNRNGKLDAHDFKMLRGEKSVDEATLGVPLKGHPYHKKTDAELKYIQKDAAEAAKAMKGHSPRSEAKYLDQVNDASTVLHYRSKGGKQLAKESVESIDELNKDTLYSYVGKASKDQDKSDRDTSAAIKANDPAKANKANARYLKRDAGIERAQNKLNREEVESIDEISKGTLLSYVKKGEKQQGKNFDDILAAHKDNDQPKANKANAKYLKRNAGLDRAVDKMYSKYDKKTEEVEIDEGDELNMRHKFVFNKTPAGKSREVARNRAELKDQMKRQKAMGGISGPKGKLPEETELEEIESIDEVSYSAKSARAGKDIGKPGKMFSKIASSAAKRYGSKESGERVAGAVLANLRKEDISEDLKGDMHPDADKVLKHIKPEHQAVYKPFLKKGMYKGNYADRAAVLNAAEKAGHTLSEKKGDSDLGTFTDNNMGEMTDAQMKERERIVKGMKKGLAGFKERYGKRAKDVMYATATKQAMKDEAIDPNVKTTDTLSGRIKGGEANQFKSYKVKLKEEEMDSENTPISRAKNLAKAAYKKLKNETMMGKAGGTSEEKK